VINAAIYLTTDNALAQAGLLIGPERILRVEPGADGGTIPLDDWTNATRLLPADATVCFSKFESELRAFFAGTVEPRHRFYGPEHPNR